MKSSHREYRPHSADLVPQLGTREVASLFLVGVQSSYITRCKYMLEYSEALR